MLLYFMISQLSHLIDLKANRMGNRLYFIDGCYCCLYLYKLLPDHLNLLLLLVRLGGLGIWCKKI
jgi:hypothetical protein